MTKREFFAFLILCVLFNSAYAQKDTLNKNGFFAIKTDLIELSFNLFGVVNSGALTIEKGFSNRHSIQLTGRYTKYIHFISQGWEIIPEYKYFISKRKNFKGFYTGLYLKYGSETDKDLYESGSNGNKYITKEYQNYGGGGTFGFQTYIRKHLTIDFLLGIGVKYYVRQLNVPSDYYIGGASYTVDNKYPITHSDSRVSINLGYKF